MMTEAEIERALIGWKAAADILRRTNDDEFSDWSQGLADGYVGALELVLNG
jgi:hypothetical protein